MPASAVNSAVYDKDDALEHAGGDPALARRFLDMLLESLPQAERSLASALGNNNTAGLREHAHRLAGAAAYCGACALRRAALRLETRVRENDRKGNSLLTRELLEQITRFRLLVSTPDN